VELFQIQNVSLTYSNGEIQHQALQNVSASLPKGCLACLRGPSGSGKTSLLSLLGLIEPIQKGDIFFGGENFSAITEARKSELRRSTIGFVFQKFMLFDVLTAEENIEFFLARLKVPKKVRKEKMEWALESTGMIDHRKKRPTQLSGGQCQRIAIARALAKSPLVILADEPTASLDSTNARLVMEVFRRLCDSGVSVVVSSHDTLVHGMAQHIVDLRDGKICT
jgi:putative ABC transport system ATP-binding protein